MEINPNSEALSPWGGSAS